MTNFEWIKGMNVEELAEILRIKLICSVVMYVHQNTPEWIYARNQTVVILS